MNYKTQQIKQAILETLEEQDVLFTHANNEAHKEARIDAQQTYLKHLIRDEIDRMVKLINKSLKARRTSSCRYEDILKHIQNYELAKKAKLGTTQ